MEQFVLVADVLGFSAIMRNVPGELRSKRLDDWLGAINRSILPDQRRQVVSDTVFVTAATSEDGLRGLIQTARHLLEQGVVNNLPIRGAIARGDVNAINYFVAQKYVEAFAELARSPQQRTVIVPAEMGALVGTIAGIGEMVNLAKGQQQQATPVKPAAAPRRPSVPPTA